MNRVLSEGYEIIRSVVKPNEVETFRTEVERLKKITGDACIRNICRSSSIFSRLSSEIGEAYLPGLICVRSLLFDKTRKRNWPVAWHQDLTISVESRIDIPGYGPWSVKDGIHSVQPPVEILNQMVTVRVHLDDTDRTNGALKVIPRSHRSGKLTQCEIDALSTTCLYCECRAGDILVMSPLMVHSSERSQLPDHRRVLHFEYAVQNTLHSRLSWAPA